MLYLTWPNGPAIGPLHSHTITEDHIELQFSDKRSLLDWQALTNWDMQEDSLFAPISEETISFQNNRLEVAESEEISLTETVAYSYNKNYFSDRLDLIMQLSKKQFEALISITDSGDVASQLQTHFA